MANNLCRRRFVEKISKFDVLLVQETHLVEDLEATLQIPYGYKAMFQSRPETEHAPGGGVCAILRDDLPCTRLNAYCAPDLIVLDLGFAILVNAYVIPGGSPWHLWSDVEPMRKLSETMMALTLLGKPLYLLGDINARTRARQGWPDAPPRLSVDVVFPVVGQGKLLLDLTRDARLAILNGMPRFDPSSGSWTSFNKDKVNRNKRRSVVDYVLANDLGLTSATGLCVLPRGTWSDHAPVVLKLEPPEQHRLLHRDPHRAFMRPRKRELAVLPRDTELSCMYADLVEGARASTPECRLELLVGKAYSTGHAVTVYTDGSALGNGMDGARAGAGVFWGNGAKDNLAVRVPDSQTNNRAEVYAVLLALMQAHPRRPLIICSDSEYAIRSLTEWAVAHAATDWSCANGDMLRDCMSWIQARTSTLHFEHIDAHVGNHHGDASDEAAKNGASKAPVSAYATSRRLPPPAPSSLFGPALNVPKVTSSIPRGKTGAKHKKDLLRLPPAVTNPKRSHRGRARSRCMRNENLFKLTKAAREGPGPLWKFIRRLSDPRRVAVPVSSAALALVFRRRMNPSKTPSDFAAFGGLAAARVQAQNLSVVQPLVEPDGTFSRPWTSSRIAALKKRVKDKGKAGSPGVDDVAADVLMTINNDDLAELFNLCIERRDAPTIWLLSAVIALLKKNKSALDPESYRTIGLECVIVKWITLLIHEDAYEWAETHKLIPAVQNGFRPGYRTNNNVLLLRCLAERARAQDKTLYVVFADIANAFPSMNRDLLWVKLKRMGIVGRSIDWLRWLYESMTYHVRVGDDISEPFQSTIGVLIGDTASPTLWNLFMADFKIPSHPDDFSLGGVPFNFMLQADDSAMGTGSSAGAQQHISSFTINCAREGLLPCGVKTLAMILGKLPSPLPPLYMGDTRLKYTDTYNYVGFKVRSTHKNMFADHLADKASKARRVANTMFGLKVYIGCVPPWEGRVMFDARVRPHLIHGCDIVPDIDGCSDALFNVEHYVLRRLLGLNPRSMIAPLYTELGGTPVRYHRAILLLRYLDHALHLPPTHLVYAALCDSLMLYSEGHPCYIGDIAHSLATLKVPVAFPAPGDLFRDGSVSRIIESVELSLKRWLASAVKSSPRLTLIRDRLEPMRQGPARKVLTHFRQYLRVANVKHRLALTRIICGDSRFAVEIMGWRSRYREPVDMHLRLCRFCRTCLETAEHALFMCRGRQELIDRRASFWAIAVSVSDVRPPALPTTAIPTFQALLTDISTTSLLAEYTFHVVNLFDEYQPLWPAS